MRYPEWAPKILVERHKIMLEKPIHEPSPEEHIARLKLDPKYKEFSDTDWERLKRNIYRGFLYGPDQEGTKILGKLLTDQRMKDAWSSLGKRFKTNQDYQHFWFACLRAIYDWRGSQKLSSAEHKRFYTKICQKTEELRELLQEADELEFYNIIDFLSDKEIDWLIETLPIEEDASPYIKNHDDLRSYVRFTLYEVFPKLNLVLLDVHSKAVNILSMEPLVKKPKSDNAPIHLFVRRMSSWLVKKCKQPLHEVVAASAMVVFDKEGIDSDYVRKLLEN